MAEEEEIEAEEGGGKKSNNLMLIIVAVILIVILLFGGIMAYFLISEDEQAQPTAGGGGDSGVSAASRASNLLTIGPMYPMDQFIVNLLSESGGRYLKVAIDFELSDDSLAPEMDMKKSLIRDIVIRSLSSKTFEEISTVKGKERLKNEIVNRLNKVLIDGQIRHIFFTDFVVQ